MTKNGILRRPILGLIEDFIADSKNPENEYLAFRRWVIRKLEALFSG